MLALKMAVQGFMTTGEVADYLAVGLTTVRRWADQGRLKTYRLGPRGDRRFDPTDVKRMLRPD